MSWNLSHSCRTEEALDAVEQAVLARLPEGSRDASVTLTTDNGTQFTSTLFIEALHRLGITHRPYDLSSPGRQQLYRTVSLQLEGRRTV